MERTDAYSLYAPELTDDADIEYISEDMRMIDELIYDTRVMVGDAFDSTKAYTEGDLVMYENTLYKFISDKPAGNWDATKVEQTDLATEISHGGGSAEVTKEASGNPIEFTDGSSAPLVKCVTAIQGNQDLHGYDKPWVGGAGKNKLPLVLADIKSASTGGTWSGNVYELNGITYTLITDNADNILGIKINGTATATSSIRLVDNFTANYQSNMILNGCPQGGSVSSYFLYFYDDTDNVSRFIDTGNGANVDVSVINTHSVRIVFSALANATFNNVMLYPMLRLSTVSDATFEPYSNICPITAYDESTILVDGKNSFDATDTTSGYIDEHGDIVPNNDFMVTGYRMIDPNTSYVFSYYKKTTDNKAGMRIAWYDENKNFISRDGVIETTNIGEKSTSATSPANAVFARESVVNSNYGENYQFEKGTTPTTYEPYKGTSHTATFSQSIYQGNADFVGLVATAQRTVVEIDETTTLGFDYSTNICSLSNSGFAPVTNDNISQYICNRLTVHPNSQIGSMSYEFTVDGNGSIRFKVPNLTSLQDYQSWLEDNPLEIVGVLATPTTETITPTNLPLKSLLGYNHIESSTGDMEVEYITGEYQPLVDLIDSSKHVYSTAEQVVGTWIDGSTIYEKTLEYPKANLSSGANSKSHGISNFGSLVSKEALYVYGSGDSNTGIANPTNGNWFMQVRDVNSTTFAIDIGIEAYGQLSKIYVTLRYTKATQTRSLSRGGEELTKGEPIEEKETEEVNEK